MSGLVEMDVGNVYQDTVWAFIYLFTVYKIKDFNPLSTCCPCLWSLILSKCKAFQVQGTPQTHDLLQGTCPPSSIPDSVQSSLRRPPGTRPYELLVFIFATQAQAEPTLLLRVVCRSIWPLRTVLIQASVSSTCFRSTDAFQVQLKMLHQSYENTNWALPSAANRK